MSKHPLHTVTLYIHSNMTQYVVCMYRCTKASVEFSGRDAVGLEEVRCPVAGWDGVAEHHEDIPGMVPDDTQQLL